MAKYTARTTAPSTSDKNYKHTSAGGYNYCILVSGGSVLPNCVGYAWGRWRELLGKYHELSRNNAESWYLKNDGYKRGKTPKLGAVMCWRKGVAGVESDGAGHVAIVEKIYEDGSVLTSNSAWNGSRFYTKTIKPPYSLGGSYVFQGFIYLPISFDEDTKTKETTKEATKETATKATTHTVKAGENLSAIAAKYGVSLDALKKANTQIKNYNIIYAGQKIKIPTSVSSNKPTNTTASKKITHTVKTGEYLDLIAKKYGVSLDALKKANPQIKNFSLIYAGQKINIPK